MLDRGTKLGPYEILALIGAEGMGEVYRARHMKLGREVAIEGDPGCVRGGCRSAGPFRARCPGAGRVESPQHRCHLRHLGTGARDGSCSRAPC